MHGERCRDDREVLRDVVGDAEGREIAARHQHLLADLDHRQQLGRVRIEVDHVAGLLGGLRAAVHGDGDVGLRERRGVVGAVARHGDQVALRLVVADQRELLLGRRLGEEVVDAGLGRDRRRRERVVARDHHGADADRPQLAEALADAALHDVLELDDAEHAGAVRHDERRAALACDPFDVAAHAVRELAAGLLHEALDRVALRPCGCAVHRGRRRSCGCAR